MDQGLKEEFVVSWKRFFGEEYLPFIFYYTDEERHGELMNPRSIH